MIQNLWTARFCSFANAPGWVAPQGSATPDWEFGEVFLKVSSPRALREASAIWASSDARHKSVFLWNRLFKEGSEVCVWRGRYSTQGRALNIDAR